MVLVYLGGKILQNELYFLSRCKIDNAVRALLTVRFK